MIERARRRAARSAPHGKQHINRQRLVALIMIGTGLLRVLVWFTLILLFVAGVPAIKSLYASVSFVSILSVAALLLTDWGQVAASLAQLTAGDAHHDAEHNRVALTADFTQMEYDVARLAKLTPGPDADALASDIAARLSR